MSVLTSLILDVTLNVQAAAASRQDFGAILGIFDHSVTTNRQDGPYASIAEVETAGFTAAAEPQVHAWATAVFAQPNGIDRVVIGREDAGDADWTATATAVFAADPTSFYFVNIESRVDADIQDVYNYVESYTPGKLFIAQTDDLSSTEAAVATAANIARTGFCYYGTDTVYLDAAHTSWSGGFNLDSPGGQGPWFNHQLRGITASTLTSANGSSLTAAFVTFFASAGDLSFDWVGKQANGRETRTQVSLDWLDARLKEAYLSAIVGAEPGVSLDDAGIAYIAGVLQEVLDQGVTYGHLTADGANGRPTITVPTFQALATADVNAGILRLTGQATLAKSLEKVVLVINLSLT